MRIFRIKHKNRICKGFIHRLRRANAGLGALDVPKKTHEFQYRTAESFLKNLPKIGTEKNVDLSLYKEGIKVYHRKFGEGVINIVEPEGEDLKLDIDFEKVGHKRLMARFANLEII